MGKREKNCLHNSVAILKKYKVKELQHYISEKGIYKRGRKTKLPCRKEKLSEIIYKKEGPTFNIDEGFESIFKDSEELFRNELEDYEKKTFEKFRMMISETMQDGRPNLSTKIPFGYFPRSIFYKIFYIKKDSILTNKTRTWKVSRNTVKMDGVEKHEIKIERTINDPEKYEMFKDIVFKDYKRYLNRFYDEDTTLFIEMYETKFKFKLEKLKITYNINKEYLFFETKFESLQYDDLLNIWK